jgi:site-specific DNA-methyltransferase (adenine-specific)
VLGRWPANLVLTDPIFDGGIAGVVGGGTATVNQPGQHDYNSRQTYGEFDGERGPFGYGDTGTYSRFFLIPKAARSDREPVLGGLRTGSGNERNTRRANVHPTVKSTDLMRHLVRLVTPTGGTVLDPFAGSGSTLLAAELEGFEWIGIEREAEYCAIAEARLNGTQRGLGLPA